MRKSPVIITLLMALLLMIGCQAAPDKQIVVSKQSQSLDTALQETQSAVESIDPQFHYVEMFTSTDGSVQFHLNISQELNSTKMPVLEVIPMSITSEDCQRVAQALLGDVTFYEREPTSNPQYSKTQYQEMLMRYSPYTNLEAMTDLVGSGSAEDMLESVKSTIKWITNAMETAPEENPHTLCDWTLKKERVYNDNYWEIGERILSEDNDWLVATAEKDGFGYKYMVVSRNREDYKLNRFTMQLGGASVDAYMDRLIYWSKLCRTGKPSPQKISDIEAEVLAILESMDLGHWRIAESFIETYDMGAEPEYMLRVYAVPILNGTPVVYGQENIAKSEDYTGAYVLTQANFLMSENGDLIEMQLDSPLQVKSVVNENVKTLSMNELMGRTKNQLSLSDAGNYGLSMEQISMYETQMGEEIVCHVEISHGEYGLARIPVEDSNDSYYYVPALMLRGSAEYRGTTSNNVYFASSNNVLESILCLNAIDGSVVE